MNNYDFILSFKLDIIFLLDDVPIKVELFTDMDNFSAVLYIYYLNFV